MRNKLILIIAALISITACKKLDTYQKINSIENAEWLHGDMQEFSFNIEDTSAEYHHYFILRNDENYDFSNIWIKIFIKHPGDSLYTDSFMQEFILFDKNGASYGEKQASFWNYKMPVIHKRLLFDKGPGEYTLGIKQVMREEQLHALLNVGWCIEKKN